jgi:hypothetical protein
LHILENGMPAASAAAQKPTAQQQTTDDIWQAASSYTPRTQRIDIFSLAALWRHLGGVDSEICLVWKCFQPVSKVRGALVGKTWSYKTAQLLGRFAEIWLLLMLICCEKKILFLH